MSLKVFADEFRPGQGSIYSHSTQMKEMYESEENRGGFWRTFRNSGIDFCQTQGKKILEGASLCASIFHEAMGSTPLGEMAGRLDSAIGITNGVWSMMVSMPSDGIEMGKNIGKIWTDWGREEKSAAQMKRIKDLFFKNIAGMGKSICSMLRFIDKEIVSIGVEKLRPLGIAGSVFGIVCLLNSLFDNAMRGVYFWTTEDVVRAQDVAANAFNSVSNITYLALTVLGLIALVAGGVVISPWVPIALLGFAFAMGLIGWFLERICTDSEWAKDPGCRKTKAVVV